jgi:hypothetical protein
MSNKIPSAQQQGVLEMQIKVLLVKNVALLFLLNDHILTIFTKSSGRQIGTEGRGWVDGATIDFNKNTKETNTLLNKCTQCPKYTPGRFEGVQPPIFHCFHK